MSVQVSIIVTTRNNHETLEACLRSIQDQTYRDFELIVVDNSSTDNTKEIAGRFADKVYNKGPERSAQRNFAATKASGDYLLVVDSDMELSSEVVAQCVAKAESDKTISAIIIPEESFGVGFWAQCKRLERSYYIGQDAIEAARFFRKKDFNKIGGYNEALTGGEDWDLTRCMKTLGRHDRITAFIYHNEGRPRFSRTVRKMYYYGSHAAEYFAANPTHSALTDQSGPLQRYKLFLSQPGKLLRNPLVGIGMLTLKTAEYAAGGLGMMTSRRKAREIRV